MFCMTSLTVRGEHVALKDRDAKNIQAYIFEEKLHCTVPFRIKRILKRSCSEEQFNSGTASNALNSIFDFLI